MKTPDPLSALRFQVRALWGAVLVFGCVAADLGVRPIHISNADDTPDTTVSLSGPRWTGTLDAARLPADPVEGKSVSPVSVNANTGVQAGVYFATRTGNFAVDDTGIYLFGNQIANSDGGLIAPGYLSAPVVYAGTVQLSGGGQFSSEGSQLIWIDPFGTSHVIVTSP